MVSEQLINWIKSAKAKGFSDDQLKQKMLSQGYQLHDVQDALMAAQPPVHSALKSPYADFDPEKEKKPARRIHHTNTKLYLKTVLMVILFIAAGFFLYTTVTASNVMCETDLECNDGDSSSVDMCIFPGLESSYCINAPEKIVVPTASNKFSLALDESISFDVKGSFYVLSVNKIGTGSGLVSLFSPKKVLIVQSGNSYNIDLNNDGVFEFQLKDIVIEDDKMSIEIIV